MKKVKFMTLGQLKDKHIGKVGAEERDKYEFDLKVEYNGKKENNRSSR